MSLHALDAIDDALNATRRYRPRGLFEWVWVVGVAAFVGSPAIGLPTFGSGGGSLTPEQRASFREAVPATVPEEAQAIAFGVVAGLVAAWLLFVVLGAFLEFAFLRWLRDGDLAIREEIGRHWRGALGLAVFRLLLGGLSFAVLAGSVVAVVGYDAHPAEYLFALMDLQIAFGLVALLFGVVTAFTTAFVVPAMWLEGRGVLSGWRRVWGTIAGAPKQFLAYAVLVAILATVGGILIGIAVLVGIVPGLIAGLVAASAVGGPAGLAVGAVVGGAVTAVVGSVVYALVQIYLRYYALFVLGDVDGDLDAIPGRRRAVRADGGADDADDADDGGADRSGDGEARSGEGRPGEGRPGEDDAADSAADGAPGRDGDAGDDDGGFRAP